MESVKFGVLAVLKNYNVLLNSNLKISKNQKRHEKVKIILKF